jgi:hypothetical protein
VSRQGRDEHEAIRAPSVTVTHPPLTARGTGRGNPVSPPGALRGAELRDVFGTATRIRPPSAGRCRTEHDRPQPASVQVRGRFCW